MSEWITIELSDKIFESQFVCEEQSPKNKKSDIIENIQHRCLTYGKLDEQHYIARKTGAMSKDQDYEKDQNVYDQNDSFIDDEEVERINHAMIIPQSKLEDYQMIEGNLDKFLKSGAYKERIQILRMHKTPDPKSKAYKKKKKQEMKNEQVIIVND